MVLAEFVKLKHGIYKSCGIECFECIMLEPYLLQPCFHVAGRLRSDRHAARLARTQLVLSHGRYDAIWAAPGTGGQRPSC